MSIFNVQKNKAICVLPWVHKHLDLKGNQKPCCFGDTFKENRTLKNIQKEMLKGIKPIECSMCYQLESNNESSNRIRETIDWLKKFGNPNIDNPIIEYLDIRNDPTCNLKCKTCGPSASTLWAKEKNIEVVLPNHNMSIYNKEKLKKIYLAGGEPTYNRTYLIFLKELLNVNPNCEVIINTNLKKLPEEWKEIIKSFKNLTVIISCDAVEKLGCYLRYPLDWAQFETNVRFVSENSNFTMFNLVPSNLSLHTIDRTVEWMSQYSNNISITTLHGEIWEYCSVPLEFRKKYITSLEKLKKFPVSNWLAHKFRLNLNSLISKYSSNYYDQRMHTKLRQEIQEQDSRRTTQLREVDPFLYTWIFAK